MRAIFRDQQLQAQYDPNGYSTLGLLSPHEVQAILDELSRLRPHDNFSPLDPSGPGFTYHCSFLDSNHEYRRQVYQLITRFFAEKLDQVLQGFRILNCNFYVKPPRFGEFVIHQNWPAITDINDTTVTVWCPLVDVEANNGALQVVPGSHKIIPHIEGPNSPAYFSNFRDRLITDYLQPIPMKAGDIVVFDDGLIHWSANNDSDSARIAIQILCVPCDSQPCFWFYDEGNPDRFELIEADSEFFLENDAKDLCRRQANWKSLGYAPNHNRMLDEAEFAELLKNGAAIRAELAARWQPQRRPPVNG